MNGEKDNKPKSILVTGASSGIARDIAQYLHKKGYKVIAAARRLNRMAPLKVQGIYTVKMDGAILHRLTRRWQTFVVMLERLMSLSIPLA